MKLRSKAVSGVLLAGAVLALAAGARALEQAGVVPRQIAPYRAAHPEQGGRVLAFAAWAGSRVTAAERGEGAFALAPGRIGFQATPLAPGPGRVLPVASAAAASAALAKAQTGDVIELMPGTYRFSGKAISTSNAANVTLRAKVPGSVTLELATVEGFLIHAPGWTFENLQIVGVCKMDKQCEHAFHVVGKASGFVSRNNLVSDFNAHFKINGEQGHYPDHGLVESSSLINRSVRRTGSPVTPVDLVGASGWILRANYIADFIKGEGDKISYGAFAKGAGSGNRFERNVVVCEAALRGAPGQRIGLSLGGGGSSRASCRDQRCISEQFGGVLESNLIASCSDEGIYLNRASTSQIRHNTLIDTAGVLLRYPETSADVEGNLVDGRIHAGRGALLRASDNLATGVVRQFLGSHPLRALFAAPMQGRLGWSGAPPRRAVAGPAAPDLCGAIRPALPAYGAFEQFGACLGTR